MIIYFSSGEAAHGFKDGQHAGVAIAIRSNLVKLIKDIEPYSSRLMHLILSGTPDIALIIAYAPTAPDSNAEKQTFTPV